MRPVHHRALLIAIMLACSVPVEASAQSPTASAASAGCTYATCALRVERSLFAERLVRGATEERVSTLGVFGSGVEVLTSGSDSAAVHAQSYVWNVKRSALIGGAGAVALGIVFSHTNGFQGGQFSNGYVITTIAGAIATVVSVPFALRAPRELSRAIWWYNSALPR